MSGNLKIEDVDRILLGVDALLIVLTNMTEASNMIRAGGESGISDEDFKAVKKKTAESFDKFSALVDKMNAEDGQS